MSDLKLFRITSGTAAELQSTSMALEKQLQTLIERNMETLFGVRFLASEYFTGTRHGGRLDSLGIDENGSPVIFEYKRSRDENVINQGLFPMASNWLTGSRATFEPSGISAPVISKSRSAPRETWNGRPTCSSAATTRADRRRVEPAGEAPPARLARRHLSDHHHRRDAAGPAPDLGAGPAYGKRSVR